MTFDQLSLGELIETAVGKGLIEFCYFAKDQIVISLGGVLLSYAPDEGKQFLVVFLQGWMRTQAQKKREAVAGKRGPVEPSPTEAQLPEALRAAPSARPTGTPEGAEGVDPDTALPPWFLRR